MSDHALLSPSGAHRWLECPASIAMEYVLKMLGVIPKDSSTPQAREGTATHELAEIYRNCDSSINDYLGHDIVVNYEDENGKPQKDVITVNQEMIDAVEMYWNYIDSAPHEKEWIEKRVNYDHLVKGQFGISDCFFVTVEKVDKDGNPSSNGKPRTTLYVVDLKYGFSKVDAFKNPQGMLYASGALKDYKNEFGRKIERVVIAIVQPRLNWISEYAISVQDLTAWGKDVVKPKAEIAMGLYKFAKDAKPTPDAEGKYDLVIKPEFFNPGEKTCNWCGAKAFCKAQAKAIFKTAIDGFSDLTNDEQNNIKKFVPVFKNKPMIDPLIMSNEDLSATWKMFSHIKKFMENTEAVILKKLLDGESIPDLKPIQALGKRKWKASHNEDVGNGYTLKGLISDITDLAYTDIMTIPDLESPNVILDILKKTFKGEKNWKPKWERLEKEAIIRAQGKIKIALESDKAESIAPSPKNDLDFMDISDDTDDLDFMDISDDIDDLDFLDMSFEDLT